MESTSDPHRLAHLSIPGGPRAAADSWADISEGDRLRNTPTRELDQSSIFAGRGHHRLNAAVYEKALDLTASIGVRSGGPGRAVGAGSRLQLT